MTDETRSTQVRLGPTTARALRNLAKRFGYTVSRGVGAGEIGNAADLLDALAARYQAEPEAVERAMAAALGARADLSG